MTIYYVARGDSGHGWQAAGCNGADGLVPATESVTGASNQLEAAFDAQLAQRSQSIGGSGLYNPLWQSRLRYASATKHGDNVTVNLTGDLRIPGDCDGPLIRDLLKYLAQKASGARTATVLIDGKSIDDLTGGRG